MWVGGIQRSGWIVALALSPALAMAAEGAPSPVTARGSAAWSAMVGNTVEGTTPDGPYTEHYAADGAMVHVDRDGRHAGRWTLKGDLVCFSYPDDSEEDCLTPELDGSKGAYVDADGTPYPFELVPGNPKGL